ncbi:uncharacterized protein TNCV_3748221 [Trichonephila clavipes]|nr:uncharacterized protein TNCV_3748221 [Trichonephila clavipes]
MCKEIGLELNVQNDVKLKVTNYTHDFQIGKGFVGPVPYKTLVEDEVKEEPVVTYNCDYCEYRSPTQKGLRCHRVTVHRIGVGVRRTLDTYGRPLAYFG